MDNYNMSHEDIDYISALHSRGYRVTSQRLIVLDAVCEHQGHATITDIHASVKHMDDSIDRSTIYRSLEVLREVGLIVEADMEGVGKIYRIAGESNHHHLVCIVCGNILTIQQNDVEPLLQYLQDTYGFAVQIDHLVFNGYCSPCQSNTR